MSKAFKKINNPKDLSLIRVFVKDRIGEIQSKIKGKAIKHCKNIELEHTYREIFKSNPVVDFLEHKRLMRESGKKAQVYFIGNTDYELVKIGFSSEPEKRVKQLQTGCPFPITILHTEVGTPKNESELHRRFSKHRVNGEWFKLSLSILNYIQKA